MILVDLERVGAHRPDRALFEDLSVTLRDGDRLGVVGRNGTGKSTLLRLLAGVDEPEEGIVRRGRDVRVGFLSQTPDLLPGTVRETVAGAAGPARPEHWEADSILDRLGMSSLVDADVATLSGGEAKRVALARVLVHEVDLLVLDEPTNHLDLDGITWLEDRLATFRGGLVLVTHDRHVLDRLTTRIVELDRGRQFVHDGGYASYLAARSERAEREATAETVRRNLARAELAWLRRGAPARTRKPKARIAAATAVVEGGAERSAAGAGRRGDLDLSAGPGGEGVPRLGDNVITLGGVGHCFNGAGAGAFSGAGTGEDAGEGWLFRDLDLALEPGGRLGVVGPNGSGKSTLLDIFARRLTPEEGTVDTAPSVRVGYYDQVGGTLDVTKPVREAVAGAAGQPSWDQVRMMERFWFDADAQWAPIGTLSGGERRRLQLLLVLTSRPNVLLLDEPTNDLDLDTLRALEDYLETWPGSLVMVSHDRALLERTVEDVIVLDGRGGARLPAGGYAEYEAAHRRKAAIPPPPTQARPRDRTGQSRTAPATDAVRTKVRSPSTLRRLVALAEREMADTAGERERLEAELAALSNDPGTRGDYGALVAAAKALAEADARLAAAEERWLALAEELG